MDDTSKWDEGYDCGFEACDKSLQPYIRSLEEKLQSLSEERSYIIKENKALKEKMEN